MEDEAIRQGMADLKDGTAYDRLYQSALCRAQADWLVGINATRLFSILYGQTLNVGRVMTPTLALIVQREQDVQAFQPEPFYTPVIDCGGFTATGDRQQDKEKAMQTSAACNGKPATVQNIEKQQKTAPPPKLYDLTSLQRDANRLYGFTAQQTLDYLQNLYEKKLTTYPRTDSQYLTSDMADTGNQITLAMTGILPQMQGISFSPDIGRVLNSSKVTDHHAIIPTMESVKKGVEDLPTTEKAIWTLVANRLMCATADTHEFETVSAVLDCAGFPFVAKGKTILHDGWKGIDRAFLATLKDKPKAEQEETALPELVDSQKFEMVAASVKDGKTTSPKRYTEDTLLSAMETAGAADMPDDAERKGLGTPATRASTIEKLVNTGFVERKKKNLFPTDKGSNLITVLPDAIKSPALTAEWETMLKQVERGEMSADVFIGGIRGLLESLMANAQTSDAYRYLFPSEDKREAIGVCPRCGQQVREGNKGFFCENRECAFALWKENKFFSKKKKTLNKKTAVTLLKEGRIFLCGL